jgi:hypothetical protein
MKRILSLALTVAMLATLITVTVPTAMAARTDFTLVFQDLGRGPGKYLELETFTVDLMLSNNTNHIESISDMAVEYDNNILELITASGTTWSNFPSFSFELSVDPGPPIKALFTGAALNTGGNITVANPALPLATLTFKVKEDAYVNTELETPEHTSLVDLTSRPQDVTCALVGSTAAPGANFNGDRIVIAQVGTEFEVSGLPAAAMVGLSGTDLPRIRLGSAVGVATTTKITVPDQVAGVVHLEAPEFGVAGWEFDHWSGAIPAAGNAAWQGGSATTRIASFSYTGVEDEELEIFANYLPIVTIDLVPAIGGGAATWPGGFDPILSGRKEMGTITFPLMDHPVNVATGWEVFGVSTSAFVGNVLTVNAPVTVRPVARAPQLRVVSAGSALFGINPAAGSTNGGVNGAALQTTVPLSAPLAPGSTHFVTGGVNTRQPIGWTASHGTFANAGLLETIYTVPTSFPTNPARDIVLTFSWRTGDDTDPSTYRVTVESEGAVGYGPTGSQDTLFRAGEVVTINAGTREGSEFTGWRVIFQPNTPTAAVTAFKFADANSATTTFVMPSLNPASGLTVVATWDGEVIEDIVELRPDTAAVLKALEDAEACALVLDFTGAGDPGDNFNIYIPVVIKEAVVGLSMDIVVETATVAVKLDTEAQIAALTMAADEVVIEVRKVPGSDIYSLAAVVEGYKTIPDFGDGHVTVSLPYTLGADENENAVVAVDADGGVVRSMYEDGAVMFLTSALGTFSVIEADSINFIDRDATSASMYDHAIFVSSRGLFKGYTDGTFIPNGDITYAEMAAVLANMDGQTFTNFPNQHINWAEEAGVFAGVDYVATADVTREDMAQMIYNYYLILGIKVCCDLRELDFSDIDGSYAKEAIQILANKGIISGRVGGYFDPATTITRVEVAAIIGEFVKAFRLCDDVIVVESH